MKNILDENLEEAKTYFSSLSPFWKVLFISGCIVVAAAGVIIFNLSLVYIHENF